jgi:hypothetical protein
MGVASDPRTGTRLALHLLFLVALPFGIQDVSADSAPPYEIYFDAISPDMPSNGRIVFDGVRVRGFGFTLERDAFRLEYGFDYGTLNFVVEPRSARAYLGVGVFHNENMAIDVEPSQPTYGVDGAAYSCDRVYDFVSARGDPFVADLDLKVGHVISWLLDEPSANYYHLFCGPNLYTMQYGKEQAGTISVAHRVLEAGLYRLEVGPLEAQTLNFKIRIFNANNRKLQYIGDGSGINVGFEENIRDYAKYAVYVNADDVLNVSDPRDPDMELKLVNSRGLLMSDSFGLPLLHYVLADDLYYLFIQSTRGWGGTYSGHVTITRASQAAFRRTDGGASPSTLSSSAAPTRPK